MHENRETSALTVAGQSGPGRGKARPTCGGAGGKRGCPGEQERTTHGSDSEQSNYVTGVSSCAPTGAGREAGEIHEPTSPSLYTVTTELLHARYYALQRKSAAGVDGVTWNEYEAGFASRITDLHSRVHRGAYRAQPPKLYVGEKDLLTETGWPAAANRHRGVGG